ncbi:MAG: glycosyltransferase family 87 protein [Acidobacteriota bacterium]
MNVEAPPRTTTSELPRSSILICIGFTAAVLWGLIAWCNAMGFSDGADFVSFYTAGRIVRDGAASQLYDTGLQLEYQQKIFARANLLPYYHPSFETILFVPLAFLSYSRAYVVWAGLNVVMMMLLPFLLRPFITAPRNFLGVALLCFLFLPLWIALLQGQDSILLLLLFTLSFRALMRNRPVTAGLLIGVAMFKFQFALPLLVVLLGLRSVRLIAGAIVGGLTAVMASFAVTGIDGQIAFVRLLLSTNKTLAWATIEPSIMPNVRGFLTTLLSAAMTAESVRMLVTVASVGIVLLATVVVFVSASRKGSSVPTQFSLAALAMVMVSYHLNPHDLSLLLLPLLLAGQAISVSHEPLSLRIPLAATVLTLYSPVTLLVLMQHSSLNFAFVPIAFLAVLLAIGIVLTERVQNEAATDARMAVAPGGLEP